MFHRIQVRDAMAMSQTTHVRGFAPGPRRHNPVHSFEGDVSCGQPYDRASTPRLRGAPTTRGAE
eukprot:5024442-Pyramimonas_sp.AAC.1